MLNEECYNRKIDELGRVIIPLQIREELDLGRGESLKLQKKGNSIVLTKVLRSQK